MRKPYRFKAQLYSRALVAVEPFARCLFLGSVCPVIAAFAPPKTSGIGKGKLPHMLHVPIFCVALCMQGGEIRADFFREQLFSFQSPAVQWMARTSSLNCLPVEILTKPLIHWIASPLFTEKPFLCSLKSASSHPLHKKRLWIRAQGLGFDLWICVGKASGLTLDLLGCRFDLESCFFRL